MNAYRVEGETAVILLDRRRTGETWECLIDVADLDRAFMPGVKWCGHVNHDGYRWVAGQRYAGGGRDNPRYERYKLCRWLLDAPAHLTVDHINRNPLDNRRCNLRLVTLAVNLQNKGLYKNNKCGVPGVKRSRTGLWEAWSCRKYLGCFPTVEEARQAREEVHPRVGNS